MASWNPLWANVHHYVDLTRASRQAPSLGIGYLLLHFTLAVLATTLLLFRAELWSADLRVGSALAVVWSVVAVGALFDRRRWAVPCELLRLGVLWAAGAAVAARLLGGALFGVAVAGSLVFAAASAAWLLRFRPALRAPPLSAAAVS